MGHLKCYKTRDSLPKATYTVDMLPGPGLNVPTELGCTLRVGARAICVEVDKQNVSPPPPGGGPAIPPNAGSVFISYKVKCPRQPVPVLALGDQFGAGSFTLGTVGKVTQVLVPASAGPANDHFECYKAKDARPTASYTMDLIAGVAGFANELGCTVSLGAKQLCVQATKSSVTPPPPGGGPGPGPDSGAKFIAYKLKCAKGIVPPAAFADQFGAGTFTPKPPSTLLVPARSCTVVRARAAC
jgi:hypothetical protein